MRPEVPITHFEPSVAVKVMQRLHKILRGNVSFGDGINRDNIDGEWIPVITAGAADTEFPVAHTLGRVPVGYDVKMRDAAGIVYNGVTPWTKTTIYLRCSVGGVNLKLFVH